MLIGKTFEEWLQQFNSSLHIEVIYTTYVDPETNEEIKEKNPNVENLYYKDEFLGCVPRGSKSSSMWVNTVNDTREATGYSTDYGAYHRSLPGVGKQLLNKKLISKEQFHKHFLSDAVKSAVKRAVKDMMKLSPDQVTNLYRKNK